jgi:hypothetical protein
VVEAKPAQNIENSTTTTAEVKKEEPVKTETKNS